MNPDDAETAPSSGLHHLELWTADLSASEPAWHWLLESLGWRFERVEGWDEGRTWHHPDGSYIVLEKSPDVSGERADRMLPGMNHVALRVANRRVLDGIREQSAAHGWTELFGKKYPHAGGEDHTAWYGEDPEGIEVELVSS